MLRTIRSRSPLSRRALPAGVDYRLRSALKALLSFGPTPVEMYANTSNAGLRRRIRTAPAIPFVSLDTPTDAPPAPKWASFTGGDGQYNGLISRPQLLLPLRVLDAIIYQIDLASDSLFTANLETVSEGQTRTFNKGGFSSVNRYARVRAKFPTSDWTGWIAFGLPTAVASGTVPTALSELTGDLDDVGDSATRFAAEEANANRTETRTSADTALVSGTAAATVETGAVRANAGLDGSGDLARNILQARADGSNLLRRSAGGLYSGDLAATLGAGWGTNLSGRPTELTDGRIPAGMDSVGDLLRNVKTNRVIEASILSGAVALSKLKTETSNRIFTSDVKRTNIEAKEPAEVNADATVAHWLDAAVTTATAFATLGGGNTASNGWRRVAQKDVVIGADVTSIDFNITGLSELTGPPNIVNLETVGDNVGIIVATAPGLSETPTNTRAGNGTLTYSSPPTGVRKAALYIKCNILGPGATSVGANYAWKIAGVEKL